MKNSSSLSSLTSVLDAAAVSLAQRLDHLVREEIARSLSVDVMGKMLEGGIAGLASLANAASVAEGRLLEKVIAAIAESNPDLAVFTQVRLPVRDDALELVEKNPETLYRGLTLDADGRTRKVYVADLIIVDRTSKIAHVIDIKRSLGSYEVQRIIELRQRMLAAALVTPDLLYKDHKRLVIDEVRVVILEAAGKRTDVRNGIWNLGHLDHLLGVLDAAEHVRDVRRSFERLTEEHLAEARKKLRAREEPRHSIEVTQSHDFCPSASPAASGAKCQTPRVGVAPPPPIRH
jgi:hypothetical protein